MSSAWLRQLGLWLAALCLLAGCAVVPRSITLSEADLQSQLARRFPVQRSLLDTFEIELSDPQLRLDPAANRLATELRLRGGDRRSGRQLQGRLALDYGLRYEPADGSVRLVQPRVEQLQFDEPAALSSRRGEMAQRMGVALAERLLDDLVLYRLPPERLESLRRAGYRPGALRVTPAGLEIGIESLAAPAGAVAPR
jgi:Protein of unknown function (DUF1439)